MVAYEGFVQYEPNPPAVRQIAEELVTGEGAPADEVLAATACSTSPTTARDVVVINLNGDALSVNGTNLLAFDAHLSWGVERVKGLAKFAGQGLWNIRSPGTGWVALTSPRHADRRRLRPWRGRDLRRPGRAGRLVPEPQGEGQAQLQGAVAHRPGQRRGLPDGFSGQGFVVVQPSEDSTDRLRIRG